jgi:hypothetical protein
MWGVEMSVKFVFVLNVNYQLKRDLYTDKMVYVIFMIFTKLMENWKEIKDYHLKNQQNSKEDKTGKYW